MERFKNRELSWLDFNYRVLSEAKDKNIPLFERLKFLSITASNLDEFFMIRVASLKDMVHAKYIKKDIAGMTVKEQLDEISKQTHDLVTTQYNTYNRSFLPTLKHNQLIIVTEYEKLTEEQSTFVDTYFQREVYPVLTPMAVDSSRPFPLIRNKSLNIAALLSDKKKRICWTLQLYRCPLSFLVSLRFHLKMQIRLQLFFWNRLSRKISKSCF